MKRFFYDETSGTILSYEDVQSLYQEAVQDQITSDSFRVWFENVQDRNDGTLTEVYKFSMTVWMEDTETYEDIVSFGTDPDNAAANYGINHNMFEYPVCISARRIDA